MINVKDADLDSKTRSPRRAHLGRMLVVLALTACAEDMESTSAVEATILLANPGNLDDQLAIAKCGDTIELQDGTYSETPYKLSLSCSTGKRIRLVAKNRWKAVLQAGSGCSYGTSESDNVINLTGDGWIIENLSIQRGFHNIEMSSGAADNIIRNNRIEEFRERAIEVRGPNTLIERNVIGNYKYVNDCKQSNDGVGQLFGIYVNGGSVAGSVIQNNWIANIDTDTTNLHADDSGGGGSCISISGSAARITVQGNIIGYGCSKDGIRIFSNTNGQIVRDNVFAYAQGAAWSARDSSNDGTTTPTRHLFENNFIYGANIGWAGKGNDNGQNKYRNNTVIVTDLSNLGGVRTTRNAWPGVAHQYDEDQDLRSNVIYNGVRNPTANDNRSGMLALVYDYAEAFGSSPNDTCENGCKRQNLWWWNWDVDPRLWGHVVDGTWSYHSSEIAKFSTPPIFMDSANGDYRLAPGSPGIGTGVLDHTGEDDMGINTNEYLTVSKMRSAASSPVKKQNAQGTSASISGLKSDHLYLVFARTPISGGCTKTAETFTIEGKPVHPVDMNQIIHGAWYPHMQWAGGGHRYLFLGDHATDGTMNVAWTTASCADGIATVEIPTPAEAHAQLTGAPPTPPQDAMFVEPALLDDCNRTENPLSHGAKWTVDILSTDSSQLRADGTTCTKDATAGNGSAWWNAASFGPNVAVSATLPDATGPSGPGNVVMLWLRAANPGQSTATDGYACWFEPGTPRILLRRYDDSVGTTLAMDTTTSLDDGVKIGCDMNGNTLRAWIDRGSGWEEVLTATDNTYAAAGRIGVLQNGTSFTIDDIRGGSVAAQWNPPLGGFGMMCTDRRDGSGRPVSDKWQLDRPIRGPAQDRCGFLRSGVPRIRSTERARGRAQGSTRGDERRGSVSVQA